MSTPRKTLIVAMPWLLAGWASACAPPRGRRCGREVLRGQDPPHTRRSLLRVPRPDLWQGEGEAPRRFARGAAPRRRIRARRSSRASRKGASSCSRSATTGAVAMPPKTKLDQAEIDAVAAWVKDGAPWPSESGSPGRCPRAGRWPSQAWGEEAGAFWAFQPVKSPNLPDVADTRWPRSPIDRFVLAGLEAAGLHPALSGRPADADPKGDARPARAATNSRGDRRVRARRVARCLCSRG